MVAISLRLPEEIGVRLDSLAERTGRSKTFYVREAILRYLEDMEDIYIAEQRLADLRAGRSHTFSVEEVRAELGLDD